MARVSIRSGSPSNQRKNNDEGLMMNDRQYSYEAKCSVNVGVVPVVIMGVVVVNKE